MPKYIVKLKSRRDEEIERSIKKNIPRGRLKNWFRFVNGLAVDADVDELKELISNPNVALVYPDYTAYALDELSGSWGVAKIGAGLCHEAGITGRGIKVAIPDTGQANHPDLPPYKGWDFTAWTSPGGEDGDDDPEDDNGHGTHCIGIIGARANGFGVVGVAPDSDLYALKVLNRFGSGSHSDIIQSFEWCVEHQMQVVSCSFGSRGYDPLMEEVVNMLYAQGAVIVAAAGNDGTLYAVNFPAAFSSVIAVGAVGKDGSRASFSTVGPEVEIVAPGVDVLSTFLNNGYVLKSGTSMSCPHVAGVVALLLELHPDWSPAEIRQQLALTADDRGAPGRDPYYGYGLINAAKAGGVLPPEPPPPPPPPAIKVCHIEDIGFNPAGKNLKVAVVLKPPLDGIEVSLSLESEQGTSSMSATTANGMATFMFKKVSEGEYKATVTSLSGAEWDKGQGIESKTYFFEQSGKHL